MSRKTLLSLGLLLILVGISLFQLETADPGLGWALSGARQGDAPREKASGPGGWTPDSEVGESRPAAAPRASHVADSPAVTGEGARSSWPAATAPVGATLRFEMRDPAGDDYGAGKVVYPSHRSFAPYSGLFDLQHFAVWEVNEAVVFDVKMAELNNPWNAPEGFYHPLVDIYIDSGPGGATRPARSGPQVRFDPKYAWNARIKVAPFGESRLFRVEVAGQQRPDGTSEGLRVYRLDDGATIRVEVPSRLLPDLGQQWRYYVWVAGFDVFGEDGYRDVTREGGTWEFGGARQLPAPRVIDLLARGFGPRSQVRLLREQGPGADPVLVPVGPGAPGRWFPHVFPVTMLLVLAAMGVLFIGVWRVQRSRGLSGGGRGAGLTGRPHPFRRR